MYQSRKRKIIHIARGNEIADRPGSLYASNQGFFGMNRAPSNFTGGPKPMKIGNSPNQKVIDSRTQRKSGELRTGYVSYVENQTA